MTLVVHGGAGLLEPLGKICGYFGEFVAVFERDFAGGWLGFAGDFEEEGVVLLEFDGCFVL